MVPLVLAIPLAVLPFASLAGALRWSHVLQSRIAPRQRVDPGCVGTRGANAEPRISSVFGVVSAGRARG
jgi:hypothetical protein